MKKFMALATCLCMAGFGAASVFAEDYGVCSLATMHGTYAWGGTSVKNLVWSGSSGMESYDGLGHLKYYELQSDGITQSTYAGTGTYTITANCIATIIYDGDATDRWTFFVAPDGGTFYYNNNLGFGRVSGGQENRISRTLLVN
jgi:hypothetical protein